MTGEHAQINYNYSYAGSYGGNGGGVYIRDSASRFNMTGEHAQINYNYSHGDSYGGFGGGVYVKDGIFNMTGKEATIYQNTTNSYGMCVCVGTNGTFKMAANEATIDGMFNQGVYLMGTNSRFNMEAGKVLNQLYTATSSHGDSSMLASWPTGTRGWLGSAGYDGAATRVDGTGATIATGASQTITAQIHAVKLP
jgi:hypothetical protein